VSALERWLLHLSTWGSAGTGLAYLYMKHALRPADPFSVVNHPWQPHALALHVLVGPLLVFALGLIAREHILGLFREARPHPSRPSGVAAIALALPMVASGYLLQVTTAEGARSLLVVVHVACGSLFALLFLAHLLVSRPGRRGAARRRGGGRRGSGLGGGRRLAWPEDRVIESQAGSGARAAGTRLDGRRS
jgi:hypothetical protein